jgi:hypothetical protein
MATNTSQSFVPVREVRQGIMIMKDGSYRGILAASSQNFALKATEEQDAVIGAFQTFLNTLDFSTQIVMQSRQLDIRPYLESLKGKEAAQRSDLMRIQLREYASFVREFTERIRIMRKYFYIVVSYSSLVSVATGGVSLPFGLGKKEEAQENVDFEAARIQLEQRLAVVSQGLAACGVRTSPLSTEEILELLYRSFNPGLLEGSQSLIQSYTT